ncbi:hypothetical protein [Enterobacter phage 04_vB_Eclo_IJM]|nr:hypothetical protein [Enterobacter phage 02_vB_Eclo_IJM]UZT50367.1 hypothetical protein [Enterobacter phage 04_vB_Eclo_IJM]
MAYRKMTKAEVIAECRETFREFLRLSEVTT